MIQLQRCIAISGTVHAQKQLANQSRLQSKYYPINEVAKSKQSPHKSVSQLLSKQSPHKSVSQLLSKHSPHKSVSQLLSKHNPMK